PRKLWENRCIRPCETVGRLAVSTCSSVHRRRFAAVVLSLHAARALVATSTPYFLSAPLVLPSALALSTQSAVAASIEAKHGAVAAEHRLASAAGVEILQRGGNAMDAAVAAALATGVVNPSSSGLGGGGFVVFWNARRERAATIDFRETAPRG